MKNYLVMAGIALVISLVVGFTIAKPEIVNQTLGSGGNDIANSDHLCFGQVCRYAFAQQMTQNASTTCQWQTPAATTTVRVVARYTLATTSASFIEFGKSASPFATTTSLGKFNVAAGAQVTLVSSTTVATTDSGQDPLAVAAPSTWIVVKLGAGGTGSIPTGTCNFTAEAIP